ncbi:MAG: adenosylcobinamide-phosphate synthase CbiB [Pseudomonadota bacterium]
MSSATALVIALGLDGWLGEPGWLWRRLPHPAVLMGRLVGWADRALNRGGPDRGRGVTALALFVAVGIGVGWSVTALPGGRLWEILLAAILLAQRSLVDHVSAVAIALGRSVSEGRAAVARIVGRETAEMDSAQVSRAAIESAAENLSDAVVAPAFCFLIAGLPGMLVYKMINTADSMIGYKTDRYLGFGWASARADDLLNLIPARLTALLIAGLYGGLGQWRAIAADARRHRSPNAGWPEAAMARALGLALSGPRRYHGVLTEDPFVNANGRLDAGPRDIHATVLVLWRVWVALILATAAIGAVALIG